MTIATISFKDWLAQYFVASQEDSRDFVYISNLKSMYEDDVFPHLKESTSTYQVTPYSSYITWLEEAGFKVKVRASDGEGKAYIQRKTLVKPSATVTINTGI